MNTKKISTIYLMIHGRNPKFALKRTISPFQYQYNVYQPFDKIDTVKKLIEILDNEFENFLENFLNVDEKYYKGSSHRTRHYISKNIEDLYPNHTIDFAKKYYHQYKGYYIGTNVGSVEIKKYVEEMCEACEINLEQLSTIKF